ncbi:MAG: hypothetical protein G01um1014106_142 [Parcubacteria group bacterium Gr01-1014_106]|nr:MAG: hypothetical protein G01um1014106_142 [Parcubacteria group bacterium Gr01-1014_106]
MNADELVQRNVVLLPSGIVEEQALRYSRQLAERFATEFLLSPQFVAHCSLYQAAYPQRNAKRVKEVVQVIAKGFRPFQVSMNGFGIFWHTFVFWDADKSEDLRRLHHGLLEALNPLREQQLLPIHQQLLTDVQIPAPLRESIRDYGNPLAGDQERPHMTLTRLKDARDADLALERLQATADPTGAMCFEATMLYLTEVGPHGTCPRLLDGFPLG